MRIYDKMRTSFKNGWLRNTGNVINKQKIRGKELYNQKFGSIL